VILVVDWSTLNKRRWYRQKHRCRSRYNSTLDEVNVMVISSLLDYPLLVAFAKNRKCCVCSAGKKLNLASIVRLRPVAKLETFIRLYTVSRILALLKHLLKHSSLEARLTFRDFVYYYFNFILFKKYIFLFNVFILTLCL